MKRFLNSRYETGFFTPLMTILLCGIMLAESGHALAKTQEIPQEIPQETPQESKPETTMPDSTVRQEIYYTPTLEDILESDFRAYEPQEVKKMIRHLIREGVDFGGGFQSSPYDVPPVYSLFPNLQSLHYNRVNGLFLGIGRDRMDWNPRSNLFSIPNVQVHGMIGYGTASREWEYSIGAERLFGEGKRLLIGAEFYKALGTQDAWRSGLTENSLTAFFAGYDFHDYYRQEGFGFYAVQKVHSMLELSGSYLSETVFSAERNTRFSVFGKSSTMRLNPPIFDVDGDGAGAGNGAGAGDGAGAEQISVSEIDQVTFGVGLRWNPELRLLTEALSAGATVMIESGDTGETEDGARFTRYEAQTMVFYRSGPGTMVSWRGMAGTLTGDTPWYRQFHLGGVGTLRGFGFKEFSGNQMLMSNLEVKFGVPSRTNDWIREGDAYLLVFLDSGWTQFTDDLFEDAGPFTGFSSFRTADLQHSAGFGLGSSSFRFELGWPLTGENDGPSLMIRFNPTF